MSGSPLSLWGLGTPDMETIFGADRVVEAILRFEGALARALAVTGIAPEPEARSVASVCEDPIEDPESLLGTTWQRGTPVLAIVEVLRSRLSTDAERHWVHFGATTQDALDTAHMLLARDALGVLDHGMAALCWIMRDIVAEHRDQPHMARTFLQDARPTTFGMRAAGWLQATLGHLEMVRITEARLTLQLGGPVGNLADYGDRASAVVHAVANDLGLEAPDLPWHTDRSRIRSMVGVVADLVATQAKVATDVGFLASSAIGEVTTRAGGSSSIPDKENPIDAVRAMAAADVCLGAASMVDRAPPHELDRAIGSWHAEWVALPLLFSSAGAVVEAVTSLLGELEVDTETMTAAAGGVAPSIDPALVDAVLDRCSRLA